MALFYSSFSNNKRSHHDVTAIVKDYHCVSQNHGFFRHFSILAFLALWLLLGEKDKIWVLLITLKMLRHKSVKSRSLALDVENDEYLVRCNFGGCVMICSKVIEGSLRCSPVFGSQKREKSMVR